MKSIVKIAAITAVLVTVAPAHAMFNRLGSTFAKRYTPMYMNRKPLFTLGALLGTACIMPRKAHAEYEVRYNCDADLAKFTRWAIQEKNNSDFDAYNKWIKDRALVFNYCEKVVASRDEIYNRNIAYALYNADEYYTEAKMLERVRLNPSLNYRWGHEFTETAKQLQQEQTQERSK